MRVTCMRPSMLCSTRVMSPMLLVRGVLLCTLMCFQNAPYEPLPATPMLTETRIAVAKMPPMATRRWSLENRFLRTKYDAATTTHPKRRTPGKTRSKVE